VSEVALGHAGIVLGLEVSRLARNNADWHRLLEVAVLAQTLILDEDGIYDAAHFNDRLLLGLKGTTSEAELHVLKARLIGGQRNKARRGELQMMPPIGLAYDSSGAVVLDPDEQVRASVQMIFDSFRQVGSACAVVRRFQREGLTFPQRVRRGIGKGDLLWGELNHSRVIQILHNPRYTGAFVYSRFKTVPSIRTKRTTRVLKVARDEWMVFIRDVHPSYISWEEFERNQLTLRHNIGSFSPSGRGTVPREGPALLQGRVVCGICGARMRVKYQAINAGILPYYQCTIRAPRRLSANAWSLYSSKTSRSSAGRRSTSTFDFAVDIPPHSVSIDQNRWPSCARPWPAVIDKLDALLDSCSDREAAAQLNALGHRNWKGEAFTTKRAAYVRKMYGLKSRFNRLRERGFLTGGEISRQLGICISRVHDLGREGILPRQYYGNEERCLYQPLNGAVLVNGRGGRGKTMRPTLIPALSSTQEAV
jgi:DNA invertase Pin-like site-specific DNA recombinase